MNEYNNKFVIEGNSGVFYDVSLMITADSIEESMEYIKKVVSDDGFKFVSFTSCALYE